ncbi:MAG: hypothetical protein NC310_03945 [Roseburia sp.]|nr:hypothetical protein [Anaeroplasma bactoclasticum]MCM1196212.1 hypothetical protein [Roseburia sp.]MCM1556021.1 hypothetical protein [Anaeroplasma bactoclasticum]
MKKVFGAIRHFFLKIFASLKDAFLHDQLKIAKYVICTSAVLHLLLSSIQIQAISLLTDQICGVVMFLFVLLGFVCLFNAIRMKQALGKKIIFSILMLLLVMASGVSLVITYFDAFAHQKDLIQAPIIQALILSFIVLTLYLIGLVETIIAYVSYRLHLKSKKEEALA